MNEMHTIKIAQNTTKDCNEVNDGEVMKTWINDCLLD